MHGKIALPEATNIHPSPSPSVEGLSMERRLLCNNYGICLDSAIEMRWGGFSCEECKAFSPLKWDAEDRREDEFKCMALIMLIFFEDRFPHVNPGAIVERLERESRWRQEFGGVLSTRGSC